MPEIYLLALAILIASILALLMRRFRQPLVVSYILAGVVLSVFQIIKPNQLFFLQSIPEISLAFLLFLVGMELDLNEFRSLGSKVILTALGQVIISGVLLTFYLSRFLPLSSALLAGIALSLSSTILVVKLLLERKDLVSLHGKMAIGVLLVEDLLAILVLMLLAVQTNGSANLAGIMLVIAKGLLIIWLSLFSGHKILPKLLKLTAENAELLFLTAIAWCLLFVSLSLALGFSVSIGAFLAGISLAQSPYRLQISGKVKPLRDFFIMLFFINLGLQLKLGAVETGLGLVLVLSLYMALGKPLAIFLLLIFQRFRVRSAFQSAILLSSISEFSLIILFAAASLGLLGENFVSPVIFSVVLSFIISSFLITHSRTLYRYLHPLLKRLERQKTISLDFLPGEQVYQKHAILIGCHRSGQIILKNLKRLFGDQLIAVDFNPDVIEDLRSSVTPCLYGDIADPEILERLNLKEAVLIISTVRDLNDNLILLDALEKVQSKALVIITAADVHEAILLYERGAHHVSLPLNLEGQSISHLIHDHIHNLAGLMAEQERKLGELKRLVTS